MMHAVARIPARAPQTAESETIYVQRAGAKVSGLPQPVLRILTALDGQRTLAQACAHAQISVSRGVQVVRKLSALGTLDTVSTEAARSQLERSETMRGLPALRTPGFSDVEEAFFASEVPPIDECDLPFESASEKVSHFVSDLIFRLKGSAAY